MLIMEEPVVKEIAKVHGRTPAQVLVRFALQRNLIAVPNSLDRQQLKENLDVSLVYVSNRQILLLQIIFSLQNSLDWRNNNSRASFNGEPTKQ